MCIVQQAKTIAVVLSPSPIPASLRPQLYKRLGMAEAAAEAAAAAANEGLLMSALRSTFGAATAAAGGNAEDSTPTGGIFGSLRSFSTAG